MAGNPLASLPGLPQRPSLARSSASETRLTQPGIEAARSRKLNSAPTAAFRYLRTAFGLFPFGGESGIFSGMTQDLSPIAVHPTGEQSAVALGGAVAAPQQPLVVDSFAGSVR